MMNIGTYQPSQLCIKIGGLDFIKTIDTDQFFRVTNQEPSCDIRPCTGGMYNTRSQKILGINFQKIVRSLTLTLIA